MWQSSNQFMFMPHMPLWQWFAPHMPLPHSAGAALLAVPARAANVEY
jgi:hypothetical protein